MKKTLALLACLLALVIGATAQEQLNFSNLPLVSSPAPMPAGYGGLNWSNIFYVDPSQWSGAGPGYKDGLMQGKLLSQDVAFVGSKVCRLLQEACFGSITAVGINSQFLPVSATVAGGFGPTQITVTAYNNGVYVGSSFYTLNTQEQTLVFPPAWGTITQIVFQTNDGGDLVIYNFSAYLLGG